MLEGKDFPILEFDPDEKAKINPSALIERQAVPECCVMTFFGEGIDDLERQGRLKRVWEFVAGTVRLPVYVADYEGKQVGLAPAYVGAPGCAAELEELTALGFRKFIVCGGAGVLRRDIQCGKLVVPTSAVRDEGTSYHYAEPSREIECEPSALAAIESRLKADGIPYLLGKTWTTDAFYRETDDKIARRAAEGCITVEMEAAALFAVARFRKVALGLILYGGDDVSGPEWDSRQWDSREEIRRNLLDLAFKVCLDMGQQP